LSFRDKRNAVNLKDYTVENIEDGEVLKMPGTVNGQQFVIQNCKNTCIYIFDHANTVTVDDCINCKIILAAVKGRYFVNSYVFLSIFYSYVVSKLLSSYTVST
jgi:protein XRP2